MEASSINNKSDNISGQRGRLPQQCQTRKIVQKECRRVAKHFWLSGLASVVNKKLMFIRYFRLFS